MPSTIAIPLQGRFNSTAFHARNAAAFTSDQEVKRLQSVASVLEGQMDGEDVPCFAIARGMDPRPPFFIMRQPAELVISERIDKDPEIDDRDGWLALLQRHLAVDEGIIVTEWNNTAAPNGQLNWVLSCDAMRCYVERP